MRPGGMHEVLGALGWPADSRHRALVVGYVAALSVAFTAAGHVVALPAGRHAWVVELVLWAPWLVWLGYRFPRHHERAATGAGVQHPYRRAFFVHVVPGISWNFAQMARPAFAATFAGGFADLHLGPALLGIAIAVVGAGMITLALQAIGVSRALFLGEYEAESRRLVTNGIYGVMRHPLFVGGLVVSVGSAVFFADFLPLSMAAANVAVLPFYLWLEGRRCRLVFEAYRGYELGVNAVVPVSARSRQHGASLTSR